MNNEDFIEWVRGKGCTPMREDPDFEEIVTAHVRQLNNDIDRLKDKLHAWKKLHRATRDELDELKQALGVIERVMRDD